MKPRSLPRDSLLEQQVAQHPLHGRVAEADLVDEARRLGQEEVGPQAVEDQAGQARRPRPGGGCVPPVDQPEQQGQRVVEVRAVHRARAGQFDQRQLAQPVQAVALLVLAGADRQHL